ncbi:MAG: cation:proton antiporter [Steroidobacteraceae bacterium]
MEHDLPLITTLAAGFGMALALGFVAERIRIPAIVGYLTAGIIIGPATPGFVADVQIASQLAEIGVMLLMFGVGLHFSLGDLLAVRRIAVSGAVVQMGLATALGMFAAHWWGWSAGAGLVLGLSLSCASTVVLLKALEARGALETMNGRIAVGWLVVEDLVCVLVLVLLPPLAGLLGGTEPSAGRAGPLWLTIGTTLLEVAGFIALMLVAGRRALPWLLWQVARTGSRELFTLAVVAVAIGIAYGAAQLFDVSFALGAFFAGMVMRESEFSHRAAEESLPLRDAFSVLFFVSVGMLFEPRVLVEEPGRVLGVVAIVIAGKSIAALGLVLAYRYPLNAALTVATSLAQIGEFSFILAGLGISLGLLPPDAMNLVLAGALISIAANPFLFAVNEPIRRWIVGRSRLARRLEQPADPFATLPRNTERRYLEGQVVLVGYGRVGRRVAQALDARGIPYVVAERNRELVESLRAQGRVAVSGDAADPSVLKQAHIADAAMLVVATPDAIDGRRIADAARVLNAHVEIVLRTHSEADSQLLAGEGNATVFFGEEELARGMTAHILARFGRSPAVTGGSGT